MTKSSIRQQMLNMRENLNPLQVNLLSNTILVNFTNTEEYKNAKVIYLYASYRNEADTMELINKALADGKQVALPCSYLSQGIPKMDFYFISSLADLVPGYKSILEPDRRKNIIKTEELPDIIVCPGVAFDNNMNRVGYGKGFYDYYLSSHHYSDDAVKPILVGLCYSFQTSFDIPAEFNDIRMNMIITENGVTYGRNIK